MENGIRINELKWTQRVRLLEKQKATLEQQLEFQSEKAMFFDMMINIAEKDLNIKIRKKALPEQLRTMLANEKKR